jgi:glycine cleavage system aminomethyltransferase T
MSETVVSATPLSRIPLHDLHVAHDAKLVPFAGYSMPVQYAVGVLSAARSAWLRLAGKSLGKS